MGLLGRNSSGFALVTGIFAVMVTFFLSTILYQNAQRQLRLTKLSIVETELRYQALGVVNEAIALLSAGESWQDYPADQPLVFQRDGLEAKAWFEEDPDHPELLHANAVVSGNGVEQTRTRVVRRGGDLGQTIFSVYFERDGLTSLLKKSANDDEWDLIPNPRNRHFLNVEATKNGAYALNSHLPGFVLGRLEDHFGDRGSGSLNGANWNLLFGGTILDHPELTMMRDSGISNGTLSFYDAGTGEWSDIFTFRRGEMAGTPAATEDGVYIPVITGTVGSKIYYINGSTGQQTEIAPPPSLVFGDSGEVLTGDLGGVSTLMCAPNSGLLFAGNLFTNGVSIMRQQPDGSWEMLPAAPTSYIDEQGVEQPGNPSTSNSMLVGVTGQDEPVIKVGRRFDSETGLPLERRGDSLFILKDQGWERVPPPSNGVLVDGEFVESQGTEQSFHTVSVDSDNRITTSSYRDGPDINRVFEDGTWSFVPPTPRKYNNFQGVEVQAEGYHDELMDLSAGKITDTESDDRYVPLSTY